MPHRTVSCPRCEASHSYLLSANKTRHLRQCPDCEGWFLIHAPDDADPADFEVESLGVPATCPVEGCEEEFSGDGLPKHILERHDGTF